MIVLDASAGVELLLGTATGLRVQARVAAAGTLHAPHLVDVEVAQVLRKCVASGAVTERRAGEALEDLAALELTRYPHALFLARIWSLRRNLTAYDALYVALAEALKAPLVTCDRRLGRSSGHRARIEVATE